MNTNVVQYIVILDFESCRKFIASSNHDENENTKDKEDLEDISWLYEITEFPSLLVDVGSKQVISQFHCYVKPQVIESHIVQKYVERKYAPMGLNQQAFNKYQEWFIQHNLIAPESVNNNQQSASVSTANFLVLTCGDWDLGRMLPSNLKLLNMGKVPSFLSSWCNIKDMYSLFYHKKRMGMKKMLQQQGLHLEGHHHLGLDDCKNIAKIVLKLLDEGCKFQTTAKLEELPTDEAQHHFSGYKVVRLELQPLPNTKPTPQKTIVYLRLNGANTTNVLNEMVKKEVTTADLNTFVKQCANKFKKFKAKRVFKKDGTDVLHMSQVVNEDVLVLSQGEDFIG